MPKNSSAHQFLIVGDIHSCADELAELIHNSGIGPNGTIIPAGDFFNKGNKPKETLELLQDYQEKSPHRRNIYGALGNHDIDFIRAEMEGKKPGLLPGQVTFNELGTQYFSQMALFLKRQSMAVQLPFGIRVVHAVLDPLKSLEEQDFRMLCGYPFEFRLRKQLEEKLGGRWYDFCPAGTITIVGHTVYEKNNSNQLKCFDYTNSRGGRIIGLDTGGCKNGFLTGFVVSEDERRGRFVYARAKANYLTETDRKISEIQRNSLDSYLKKDSFGNVLRPSSGEDRFVTTELMRGAVKPITVLDVYGREIVPASRGGNLQLEKYDQGHRHIPSGKHGSWMTAYNRAKKEMKNSGSNIRWS